MEFFLILLGTNCLEGIFSLIRSQNGSDVNVSMYSLSSWMSGAVECHSILLQQPELDCGPCRLWLQGLSVVMGIDQKVDHLNPALWKGDVWVSGVVMTGSPVVQMGLPSGRLGLSHWAGPSVTGSAGWSQRWYGGIIVDILAKESKFP